MKHIGSKLFAGFICMAAVTVGLLWLLQAGIMKDNYLKERVTAVDGAVQLAMENTTVDYTGIEERLNIRFLELNADGTVGYISPGMPMKGMLLRACQSKAMPAADGTIQTLTNIGGDAQYALLGRNIPTGEILYAVFSLSDVQEAEKILLKQLWIITAVLLAISVLLALLLSRMFSRPVREITGAARSMAEGKLGTTLPVRSKDEIGQLALALNVLGAQLQKTDSLRRELIANVSHELRSPLAVIQGYAETVRDVTWPYTEKREHQLTIIAEEAAHLSRIVADILDYSKLQAGVEKIVPTALALCTAMGQTANLYEQEAADRAIQIQVICDNVSIRFDRDRFAQVMGNLVSNAISHANRDSVVAVSAQSHGDRCHLSVTNTGQTIAPQELPFIWDRYYRAQTIGEEKRLGTGLGLAIVKSILEQHNLPFGVDSQDGLTTFWFDAPLTH